MSSETWRRREFLKVAGSAAATAAAAAHTPAAVPPTARQVIDLIIGKCAAKPLPRTVDTVKAGDAGQRVKGIVTTFLATREVIESAVARGANLIITHEPTFYNHLDQVDWLENDPVYAAKKRLIDDSSVVIWRFHDYWHMHDPDGITTGFLNRLGWRGYADPKMSGVCTVPSVRLDALAAELKRKLAIAKVQIVGDAQMQCSRVAFSLGAAGGNAQIGRLAMPGIDVLIVGEVNEWETSEYVRDAVRSGMKKALVILGHANSEESGMMYLAEWLRPLLPGIEVAHVPAGDPFRTV